MTAVTQTNSAIHLSRLRHVSGFRLSSLRPGDGSVSFDVAEPSIHGLVMDPQDF
jgi:hypothetical protein